VEQVVEVITEVGRTAIGALRSAVALLEADGARLRVVNDDLRNAPDSAGGQLTLESPSVMTKAIATRRPVLVEDPEDLRRQFDGELEIDPERVAASGRALLGPPAAAGGGRAAGRAAVLVRSAEEDHRGGAGLPGGAGRAVRAGGGTSRALRAGAHHGGDAAAQPCSPIGCPACPGLVLEAMYRPVAKNMEIGGDWYDAFRLADQRLAVAVGDVNGQGPDRGRPVWAGCATRCVRWR